MDQYFEYTVQAAPTKKEKMIQMGLWILAVLCLALSFLWWYFLPVAIFIAGGAYWYGSQLNYEYEYQVGADEIEAAKIIAKSNRKELCCINMGNVEMVTSDPANIQRDLNTDHVQKKVYCNETNPVACILVNDAGKKTVYMLNLNEEMLRYLKRRWPMKTRI